MVTRYTKDYSKKVTPQSEMIPGQEDRQVKNSAGGFVYQVTPMNRMTRFLILGNDGGTYYAGQRQLTRENATCVEDCLKSEGRKAVDLIVDVSDSGRAPKMDPTLFAYALACSCDDKDTRAYALKNLSKVCRIPTHLMIWAGYLKDMRGWGRGVREAVANFYNQKDPSQLAYHVAKYQSREGWSNRDLLRKAHPKAPSDLHQRIYQWITHGPEAAQIGPPEDFSGSESLGALSTIAALEAAKGASEADTIKLIETYGLTREMIDTEHLKGARVWEALLERMPLHAMVRNLGKMSQVGLVRPGSDATKRIAKYLRDANRIEKSRMHPMALLMAQHQYKEGRGLRGSLTWDPVTKVLDALDDAFYLAFGNVESTGKDLLLGLDVSGSMGWSGIAGSMLNPREATAALALVTARVEPNHEIMAFAGTFRRLDISPKDTLRTAIRKVSGLQFGRTDCSLPMQWAMKNKMHVDTFVIYTDNETWCGKIHPTQALQQYRSKFTPDARLIVNAMTATQFSIADPKDPMMLDIAGFDTATPQIMTDFIMGRI